MNFIVSKALDYAGKRLSEASTWAGIVAAATGAIGYHASPDMHAAIGQIGMAIVGAILVFVRERKGSNPLNAPLPPPGTAAVVAPTSDDRSTAVVLHDKPDQAVELQTVAKPSVVSAAARTAGPERPGFTRYDP